MPVIKNLKEPFVTVGSSNADYIVNSSADNVEIQAALAAADHVFLKNGTYALSDTLSIASGKALIGESREGVILQMASGANKTVITNANAASGITTRASVKNMTIDQQGATQSGGGGIVTTGIQLWTIESITVKPVYRFGFLALHQGNVSNLTGTITITNGSNVVSGSSTSFTTELSVGAIIKTAGGRFGRVVKIVSNTSLHLTRDWGHSTETGVTFKNITPNSNNTLRNIQFQGTINDSDNCGMGLFDYSLVENCESFGADTGGCGFVPDHAKGMRMVNLLAHDNDNSGFSYETCEDITTMGGEAYGNAANGFQLISGSTNCKAIGVDCYRNINGFKVSYNSTSFPFTDGNTFGECSSSFNSGYGARIDGAQDNRFIHFKTFNNDTGGMIANTASSRTPDNNKLIDIDAYDDRDTKVQARGIWIVTGTGNQIIDSTSLDADHVTAGITDTGTGTVILNTNTVGSNVDFSVPDEAYGSGWNGSLEVPTKNAIYDKLETVASDILFDHFADANNGTTVETDLYSDTLAAGQLSVNGQKIAANYSGTFVGDATSTQRLQAYFGGTNIFDTGALGIGASTSYWDMNVTCIRESSSIVRCAVSLTTSFATLNAYSKYTKVTGLTLSGTVVVKITGLAAGVTGGSNQITASKGFVQFVPAA